MGRTVTDRARNLAGFIYEGDIWTYSLYAPQDMRHLIGLAGGNEEFNKRLDFIFARGHFDVTNEPGFLMPLLYDYSGRPDKRADIVHLLLEKAINDSRAGIPGNDDSGVMSSGLIFQTLGVYPVAGASTWQELASHRPGTRPCGSQPSHTRRHAQRPRPSKRLVSARPDQGRMACMPVRQG